MLPEIPSDLVQRTKDVKSTVDQFRQNNIPELNRKVDKVNRYVDRWLQALTHKKRFSNQYSGQLDFLAIGIILVVFGGLIFLMAVKPKRSH